MKNAGQNKGIFMVVIGGAIAITIFSLLFVYALRSAQQSVPAVTFNETKFQEFNKTTEIINLTTKMNNAFTGNSSTGTAAGDIIQVVTTGGYNTIRIVGAIPGVYMDLMTTIAADIGIPREFATLASLFVLVAIIALFVLLVFRVYVQ